MTTPYRADQVGSLLRPPEVLEARTAHARHALSLDELRQVEDRAVLMALDLQRQVGLDVLSDGEYRRGSWSAEFAASVDGYVPGEPPIALQWRMPDGVARGTAPPGNVVGERLRQKHRLAAVDAAFLKQHAAGPYKITL